MRKKDILELKRRFKKDDCTFTKMCGCYVNGEKNILLKFNETFLNLEEDEFFKLNYGAMIVESETELNNKNAVLIGKTISSEEMRVNGETIELSELIENWESVLEMIFPSKLHMKTENIKEFTVKNNIYIVGTAAKVKFAKPRAGILVFPGNNCEYDTVRVLENNGAVANTVIFNNITHSYYVINLYFLIIL